MCVHSYPRMESKALKTVPRDRTNPSRFPETLPCGRSSSVHGVGNHIRSRGRRPGVGASALKRIAVHPGRVRIAHSSARSTCVPSSARLQARGDVPASLLQHPDPIPECGEINFFLRGSSAFGSTGSESGAVARTLVQRGPSEKVSSDSNRVSGCSEVCTVDPATVPDIQITEGDCRSTSRRMPRNRRVPIDATQLKM